MKFTGIITALITPFLKGELDKTSFLKVIREGLEQGVDGFVINGTTGESPSLSSAEVQQLVEWAQGEVSGQVPLILGVGHNNTSQACLNTKKALEYGVDGVLAVVPYYNKPTQQGLVRHFSSIAASTDLPVLLYNVPSRTALSLELDTISQLAKVKNIVGIKEASGSMEFAKDLLNQDLPKDFIILSGDDTSFLNLVELGGHGVISVSSHLLCRSMKEAYNKVLKKDIDAVEKFKVQYQDFIHLLFEVSNPIMIKQALYLKKWINSPELRLPLCEPSPSLQEAMRGWITKLG